MIEIKNTYKAYKDSGVEWLGDIPEHWVVKKLKYLFNEINERSFDGSEDLLSVSQYTGVSNKSEKLEEGGMLTNASSLEGYKKVSKDDLVSNIMLAWNGSLGFSPFDGITSPAYSIYRLKTNDANRYFHYLLRTELYKSEYKRNSSGVVESRLRLYTDDFFRIVSILPPQQEQSAIAKFLDDKTEKIDQAIRVKQEQIVLLKERRQVLIHQAVTRGLDKSVGLNDSGVEWIGEIPEHWEMKKNGMLSRIIRGASPRPAGHPMYFNGNDVPWIAVGDITRDNEVYLKYPINYLTIAGKKQSRYIEAGTFVLTNSGATLGVPKIMGISGCINDGVLAFLDLKEDIIDKLFLYFYFVTQTERLRDEMNQGATQPNLNTNIVKQLAIAVPPLNEQRSIVKNIENLEHKIYAAISLKEKEIEKLKEYKASLINSVVTGKVRVG
ncbi:restriction endonuclease subunit S [Pedobacter nototheniae]|uniref:restriction endonuclease subunit S n=1 Tax=Pedobacter nototheniae TaxID=2488994 RepID=UPI0029306DE2|nr:restriction endonuclease subunit S [Pedobacter nototheniae]